MAAGELDPSPAAAEAPADPVLAAVVAAVVAESGAEADAEGIGPEARLEALGVDSLGVLAVAVSVEERLGIRLPDVEIARVRTVGDLVASAARHLT